MRRLVSENCHGPRARITSFTVAVVSLTVLTLAQSPSALAGTLDQVRQTGTLTLGYRADAQPFSYHDASGAPAGYSVVLCQKIADQVKSELGLSALTVVWRPATLAERFNDVQQGKVDLLCGADSATLARMKDVSFSIPIFPSGIGAMLHADAPAALRQILADAPPPSHPIWRGSPAR